MQPRVLSQSMARCHGVIVPGSAGCYGHTPSPLSTHLELCYESLDILTAAVLINVLSTLLCAKRFYLS